MKLNRSKLSIYLMSLLLVFSFACSTTQEVSKVQLSRQTAANDWFNLDTVKAGQFDTGKMWTFEHAPLDYFESKYGFRPDEEWLQDVQMSALKFASWCTASFVSEDGLIMTNHHCIDFVAKSIEKEGEDILHKGFYAETLSDERKIPNVFVDQLRFIEDVTDDIAEAFNSGKTDDEKIKLRDEKIGELQDSYAEETGLICKVTSLYNGGRYSMYGYKRFKDVRAVYFNERTVGLYGGDPDNFTYPRYDADFAFVRAYDENGEPLKTENFFKFSANGAKVGEPIFVVGNPGSTQRLKTVAQLEYLRDFQYRNASFLLNNYLAKLYKLMDKYPERKAQLEGTAFFVSNSAKVYRYYLEGLRNPYFMARKKDFEKKFKANVDAKPELKRKYGHLWSDISNVITELRKTAAENSAIGMSPRMAPKYFAAAKNLLAFAEEMSKPEDRCGGEYKGDQLASTIEGLWPARFDEVMENVKLELALDYIKLNLGENHSLIKKLFIGNNAVESAAKLLSSSDVSTPEKLKALAEKGADAINNSNDPFIAFAKFVNQKRAEISAKRRELAKTEESLEEQLGLALYEVFGTSIPPDATFTLRISDGLLQGYEYNGTEAPVYTTFYGLYDRYNSHQKKAPWNLPERWQNPGPEFDLSTPYNFASTNDITGGSSGSAVINKNQEIVGIAFDGNVESIPGNFIYNPAKNRMVSVASQGILEILSDLMHAKRLAEELKAGKIVED